MYPYIWEGSATVRYQGPLVAMMLSIFILLWSVLAVTVGYLVFLKASKGKRRLAHLGAFLGGLISMLALPLF